jgi:SAM-dependent methyltransferase
MRQHDTTPAAGLPPQGHAGLAAREGTRYVRGVNAVHNLICSSRWWAGKVDGELLPWGLRDIDTGGRVLEFGPGFGATTKVLAERPGELTVLELEPSYCERLRAKLGSRVDVHQGDATRMPFEDSSFSSVLCFTMLHHLHSAELQDEAFVEAFRVLQPGGVFAGTDSLGTGMLFKVIHIGDILNPIDPTGLTGRLEACGFERISVKRGSSSFRFRAYRPA